MQWFVIALGLGLAGWGHLLLHDLFRAEAVWRAVDDRFPPVLRSSAQSAGGTLLTMGAALVLLPVLG